MSDLRKALEMALEALMQTEDVMVEVEPHVWEYRGSLVIQALRQALAQPDEVLAEREKVAQWMIERGFATGHGDSIEDLLKELEWQVAERERNACAKVCDDWPNGRDDVYSIGQAIRARGEK